MLFVEIVVFIFIFSIFKRKTKEENCMDEEKRRKLNNRKHKNNNNKKKCCNTKYNINDNSIPPID